MQYRSVLVFESYTSIVTTSSSYVCFVPVLGNGYPVEFSRVYDNVRANLPCRDESTLPPDELRSNFAEVLESESFASCNKVFKDDLK